MKKYDGLYIFAGNAKDDVLENSLACKTNPGIGRRRNGNLNFRICQHVLVNILGVVGAEPQLAILLKAEHEWAAFGLAVTAYGCQILNGIFL